MSRRSAKGTVIPQWHAECDGMSIAYLFTDDLGMSKGRQKLRSGAEGDGGGAGCLTGHDAVLVVDRLVWAKLRHRCQAASPW